MMSPDNHPSAIGRRKSRGFTLVELLVVITIIGILVALLLPAVQAAREAARRAQCQNNLKQLALALFTYESVYGCFPAADAVAIPGQCMSGQGNCRGASFTVMMLPYLEQAGLENRYDYNATPRTTTGYATSTGWNEWIVEPPLIGTYNGFFLKRLGVFQCPSDDRVQQYPNLRDYYGVVGGKTKVQTNIRGDCFGDGFFVQNRWRKARDISDGTSNSFAIGESVFPSVGCSAATANGVGCLGYGNPAVGGPDAWLGTDACSGPDCGPQTSDYSVGRTLRSTKYPINSPLPIWTQYSGCNFTSSTGGNVCPANDAPFSSFHPGGTHFVFIDGHVNFINDTINFPVYQALSTIAGGEIVPGNAY
jgi:prepilin-type N-terminal cleavage/methylation domain-containing protein/prepilin-type processing-associated H-X9-DG protein